MKRAERFDDLVELPASVINRFRWLYESVFLFDKLRMYVTKKNITQLSLTNRVTHLCNTQRCD